MYRPASRPPVLLDTSVTPLDVGEERGEEERDEENSNDEEGKDKLYT